MDFLQLKLIEPLLRALKCEGYASPTPIQEETIPPLLEGRDLMGIAQTGTGKTAAFLLPILQRITKKNKFSSGSPCVLILTPTRELAAQIENSCKTYGKFLRVRYSVIFGGVNQNPQVKALKRGVDILVATPGRLLDLMQQRHVCLNSIEIFVLDEADRMLDMGFINDVKKIIAHIPRQRQTLCFSATMSKKVELLARTLLNNPVHIEAAPQATLVEQIKQQVLFVAQEQKDDLLIDLLKQEHLEKILVFTRTKHRANKVVKKLNSAGIEADAIHGNKTQKQRTKALASFQKGSVRVLVATDIAARGIDVEKISHVINYDLPNEAEGYVHRIGRTARAGAEGTAFSFCSANERGYLHDIEQLIQQRINIMHHPRHSEMAQNAKGPASRSAHTVRRGGGQRIAQRQGSRRPSSPRRKELQRGASRHRPPKSRNNKDASRHRPPKRRHSRPNRH